MIRLLSKQSQIPRLSRLFSKSTSHPLDIIDPVTNAQKSDPQHQIKDFSYLTSRLPSLNNQDFNLLLSQFNSKPQYSEAEKKLSLNLLKELSATLDKGQIGVDEFVIIVKNLQISSESTTFLNSVLKQLLEPKHSYLAMNDLSKLIDLVFNTYKSTDYDLCKAAFNLLDQRISHNYSSIQLLDTLLICLRMQSICEDLNELVLKLSYFIQNKVELQSCEENIKVLEIYNECEETPRSFLNIAFKYFYGMNIEEKKKMDARDQMKAIYEVSQLANNRSLYVSYHFKDFLLKELNSKLNANDLDKVNYGVFFEAACMLNSIIPSKVVDCVESYFNMQKKIDYPYILCYMNLLEIGRAKVKGEVEENQERSLKELPTSEILKIFNSTINSKQNPFLKKVNSLTHKILTEISKSENYEKIMELLNCVESQALYKKSISSISTDLESCLKYIKTCQKSMSSCTYFKLVLKFYYRVPKLTERFLKELLKTTEKSELISHLHKNENFNLRTLVDLQKFFPNLTDNEKLGPFLINLNKDTTISDFVDTAKVFNSLSGSVYLSQTFEVLIHKWFKFMYFNKVENYFKPFLNNLNTFMLSLPETELRSQNALNTSKWLKTLGYLEDSLAEKLVLANKIHQTHNSLTLIYIGLKIKNPEIQDLIKNFLIPEILYSWHNIDVKPLIFRIRITCEIVKIYPELSQKLLYLLEDKLARWANIFTDDFIEILESLRDSEFCDFPELITLIVERISFKLYKESYNVGGKFLVTVFSNYCKFTTKKSKHLISLFSEIGKQYFKLTIEQKISIMKACGSVGIVNKEMFKVIFMDLQQIEDLNKILAIDALVGLCDVNLEDSEFSVEIFKDLADKINLDHRLPGYHTAKLIYCLAKAQKFDKEVKKLMEQNRISPFTYLEHPQKLLISHFLLASKGIKILNDENFAQWDSLVSNFSLWKIPESQLKLASARLKLKNHQIEVFPTLHNIRVPLLIQPSKTIIIPKTPYNTTFNNDSLKGEQTMLVTALSNHGFKVLLHDFSTPFTLNP